MSKPDFIQVHVKTLVQHTQSLGLPKAKHPLFSIQRFEDFPKIAADQRVKLSMDFYQITFKKDCPCKLKYGQTLYDFDEGVLSFFAPKQVSLIEAGDLFPPSGWLLLIHPDFLRSYPLSQKIKSYGFFDYSVSESLILSEDEQKCIETIILQMEKEYYSPIDAWSQDVMISHVELLLTYCNRFYNRQFITRKPTHDTLLTKLEALLNSYFENQTTAKKGLPTVGLLAAELHVSPKYLSDCLRQITGRNTQQHIHDRLIEQAKEKLSTTRLSVSEIAYQLGFEYPQSFSKLFKSKTSQSPLEFRHSFN